MKKIVYILLICITCGISQAKTIVCGNVLNPSEEKLSLSYVKSDLSLATEELVYKVPIDVHDRFKFSFKLDQTQILTLTYGEHAIKTFLEPNDSIHISFDANDFDNTIQITGSSVANQIYLYKQSIQFNYSVDKLLSDSSSVFLAKVDSLRDKEMAFYREFFSSYSMSKHFTQFALAEITYTNLNLKYEYAARPHLLPKKYFSFIGDVEVQNDEALISPSYRKFVKNYTNHLTPHISKKAKDAGDKYVEKYKLIKQTYKDETLYYALTEYLLLLSKQIEHQRIQKLVQEYVSTYPKKQYTNVIKKTFTDVLEVAGR